MAASKEQQANVFLQGKVWDERDTSAEVFAGAAARHESASVFGQGFSLEGIQNPDVLKQKEVFAFRQNPMHKSAEDFIGNTIDPRDVTARDFLNYQGGE